MSYLYVPLVGVAYFLALLSLLETLGLSARAASVASLLFTFSTLSVHYVAHSFQEEAIASVFVWLAIRATLLWRQSSEKRYAFGIGLFFGTTLLFRFNALFVLIPLAVLLAPGFTCNRRVVSSRTLIDRWRLPITIRT